MNGVTSVTEGNKNGTHFTNHLTFVTLDETDKDNTMTEEHKPTFGELIRESDIPVLVDFHAEWCGPCKMMSPVVKELAAKYPDKVRVIKVDVDRNPAAAGKYGVRGVPTFILFHKGEQLWRQSGAMPASMLEQVILQHA